MISIPAMVIAADQNVLNPNIALAVADRMRHIPTHAPQDDITLKMAPFKRDRHHPIPPKQSTDHILDSSHLKICDKTRLLARGRPFIRGRFKWVAGD
jgi:hypothetical protein